MFERKFALIEGESFQIHELGKEIESIVGSKLEDIVGDTSRIIGYHPSNDVELFNIRFQLSNVSDYIDVVAETDKKPNLKDYNFENETFKVNLVSYHRMSHPKESYYDEADEKA